MKRRSPHLGLLLAALALALIACTGESGTPPCTPLEGETGDPCDGDLTQVSGGGGGAMRLIESEPWSIRFYLDGGYGTQKEGHIVVRGQYIPGTVRCANRNIDRVQPYLDFATDTHEWESGLGFVRCYADLRVADYIVGSGPSTLTVLARIRGVPGRHADGRAGGGGENGDRAGVDHWRGHQLASRGAQGRNHRGGGDFLSRAGA